MNSAEGDFSAITGATPQVARHFLQMTDFDLQQAIQLYFDSPDLAATAGTAPPPVPAASRPSQAGREDDNGVVHLDSDDDFDMDAPDNASDNDSAGQAAASSNVQNTYEDDEAMARRLQAEMYQGGAMGGGGGGDDDVRAPIARTTETLLGPGAQMGPSGSIMEQLRRRGQPRSSQCHTSLLIFLY